MANKLNTASFSVGGVSTAAKLALRDTDAEARIILTGTFTGAQGKPQVSMDDTTYVDVGYAVEATNIPTSGTLNAAAVPQSILVKVNGWKYLRWNSSQVSTGTVVVTLMSSGTLGGVPGALPVTVQTSGLSASPTAPVGYGAGAGGAVTQLTSRTTGVTLNTPTGAITLFSAAGSATPFSFTLTNSQIGTGDTVTISQKSGTDKYTTQVVTAVGAGSCQITLANASGTTTEQPVFNFTVVKGSAS